ncbi:MAG: AMP-binding protein, partial [Candidatus Coatesbacteria bacterium]|nr:AMP-binding protein [Candidatus Coatesbacteria bacterium]
EPPWYGTVCPVVWEDGGSNPASYPIGLIMRFDRSTFLPMTEKIHFDVDKTIYDLLHDSAERFGQKVALNYRQSALTYSQLLGEVYKLSGKLRFCGVGKADRVFVIMPNSPGLVIAYFAIFRIGAVAVPLSIGSTHVEIDALLSHSRPTAGITTTQTSQAVERALLLNDVNPAVLISEWDEASEHRYTIFKEASPRSTVHGGPPSPEDPAVMLYTAGTTGRPKGVILTHRNIVSNTYSCQKAMPVSDSDIFLAFLPMYHSFAFTTCTVLPVLLGSTTVILPGPKKELIIDAVCRFGVTVFIGIPGLYAILSRADSTIASLFDRVRFFVSGAAPLSLQTIEAFSKLYRGPLLEGYGLTEAAPVVSLNPIDGVQKAGSIGLPLPDVSVRVVDESGCDIPPGEIGELLVRGPNVMQGYFGDADATHEKIRDGWLYTGDMARMDGDGYICIEDRKDDMILVQGSNVYPHEIEDTIRTIEGVVDVAVVGIADGHRGKRPVAVVQALEGAMIDEECILAHCREHLSKHKAPRHVHFWSELPLSPLGKPLKREIREILNSRK